MAVMRAQVSLMFDDADLFNNFITPCKEERRLNGIIVKCLKAYYSDDRVRSMIEGETSEEEAASEGVQSTQSICDSIRASLVMQNFMMEELKQTVDNGLEDVEDILSQANKKAESHGFGSSYQTKSGSTILQLEAPKQETATEEQSAPVSAGASAPNDLAAILCQAVLLLAKDSNNAQVTALLSQAGVGQQAVAPTEPTKTVRQEQPTQVLTTAPNRTSGFVEDAPVVEVESDNDFGGEPEVFASPAKPQQQSGGDAADALADLLGSL